MWKWRHVLKKRNVKLMLKLFFDNRYVFKNVDFFVEKISGRGHNILKGKNNKFLLFAHSIHVWKSATMSWFACTWVFVGVTSAYYGFVSLQSKVSTSTKELEIDKTTTICLLVWYICNMIGPNRIFNDLLWGITCYD